MVIQCAPTAVVFDDPQLEPLLTKHLTSSQFAAISDSHKDGEFPVFVCLTIRQVWPQQYPVVRTQSHGSAGGRPFNRRSDSAGTGTP